MPTAGHRATPRTGQCGHIPAAGNLDEHRVLRLQRRARRLQRHGGQSRGVGSRIPLLGKTAVLQRHHPGSGGPHHRPGGHHVVGPAGPYQRLSLGGARVAADDRGATQLVGTQHGDLAGVRIRRAGLGEIVVPVVPHQDQPEIGHRGEHRAAGTDHHLGLPA